MRETLGKEVAMYNHIEGIESCANVNLTTGMNANVSIERITAEFISEMQAGLPSTVSTISRTAFKIPSRFNAELHSTCVMCDGYLQSD